MEVADDVYVPVHAPPGSVPALVPADDQGGRSLAQHGVDLILLRYGHGHETLVLELGEEIVPCVGLCRSHLPCSPPLPSFGYGFIAPPPSFDQFVIPIGPRRDLDRSSGVESSL